MTKEELQDEFDRLSLMCGNALLQRLTYLSQEIRRLQIEESENKKKLENAK